MLKNSVRVLSGDNADSTKPDEKDAQSVSEKSEESANPSDQTDTSGVPSPKPDIDKTTTQESSATCE